VPGEPHSEPGLAPHLDAPGPPRTGWLRGRLRRFPWQHGIWQSGSQRAAGAARRIAQQEAVIRWDALFADLDAQAEALEHAERAAEVEDRTRREIGASTALDRLRMALGTPLRLRAAGAFALSGTLCRVGPGWMLLEEGGGREAVVALDALLTVSGLSRLAGVPATAGAVVSKIGLRHVLRGIARDRSSVLLHLSDASVLAATIDRVGADYLDVAVHAPGELRRPRDVREVALVPTTALVAVRREG